MDSILNVLKERFVWGLILGLGLCFLALYSNFKIKWDMKRLKSHLSDKLELEAEKLTQMKSEIDGLKKENENLRVKVSSGKGSNTDKADLEKSLEIYARAERAMMINAPGFAPAWETAKEKALQEIELEERGKSSPRKLFRKLFTRSSGGGGGEVIEALPEKSTSYTSGNGSEKNAG